MTSEPLTTASRLVARGLVAGYLRGVDILRGVSVEAPRGQVRCVLGPNGTGKSTLLKVVLRQNVQTCNGSAPTGESPVTVSAPGRRVAISDSRGG